MIKYFQNGLLIFAGRFKAPEIIVMHPLQSENKGFWMFSTSEWFYDQ